MNAQTIVTPSGDRLVVLPEAEFTALVEAAEDAVDVAAVRRFREQLAAGTEELIPAAVVDRLLAGENRILVWREHRGLTLAALAEAACLPPDALERLEASQDGVRVETLKKLATALSLTLDDLAG